MTRARTLDLCSYGVVLADPPWRFEAYSAKGEKKNPSQHYPCENTDDLITLGLSIGLDFACAPNSVMVMWATWPMLDDARRLMTAWGFRYKTGGAWIKRAKLGEKLAFGTGYIYRSACEPWLLGTRGAPAIRSHAIRNAIDAPIREHSRKPEVMHDMIAAQFDGPYLELFARQARPGWDAWGNDTGKFDAGP